jgi:hypothetical protein
MFALVWGRTGQLGTVNGAEGVDQLPQRRALGGSNSPAMVSGDMPDADPNRQRRQVRARTRPAGS